MKHSHISDSVREGARWFVNCRSDVISGVDGVVKMLFMSV